MRKQTVLSSVSAALAAAVLWAGAVSFAAWAAEDGAGVSASSPAELASLSAASLAGTVRAGALLSGRIDAVWASAVTLSEKEAFRRAKCLGFWEGTGLSEPGDTVTLGALAVAEARLSGEQPSSAEEAASLLSARGVQIPGEGESLGDGATAAHGAAMLLRVLGWDYSGSAVSRLAAGEAALALWGRKAGEEMLSAGTLGAYLFRALETTVCGDGTLTLVDRLVEAGTVSPADRLYLVYSDRQAVTDEYILAMGYEDGFLPDGYYVIQAAERPEICLNAMMSKVNTDKDGVGVTAWQATGDVSQTFRLERQADGTYRIYCAASSSGYNRLLGIAKKGTLALYRASSARAGTYRLVSAGDGTWYLADGKDRSQCLTVDGDGENGSDIRLAAGGSAPLQRWVLIRQGAVDGEGYELALYPSKTVRVTQSAYETYSHGSQNATDITTAAGRVFAPFTGKIVRIDGTDASCNAVWLESTSPVRYADGTVDYMVAVFLHDNYVGDLKVGQVIMQGQFFYDMGTAGNSAGAHVHVALTRGRYSKSMKLTGSGDVYIEDALVLLPEATVIDTNGILFRRAGEETDGIG